MPIELFQSIPMPTMNEWNAPAHFVFYQHNKIQKRLQQHQQQQPMDK